MTIENLKQIIEAVLFAFDEPLSAVKLQNLFESEKPQTTEIREAIEALKKDYEGHALELIEVSSGYRFQVKKDFSSFVKKLWEQKPPRYSRALLETLALVAYRQPITRGEIEEVRGVVVSTNIMKILLDRNWIKIVGTKNVPGHPSLYGTTKEFLDYFNLKKLSDLPPLKEWMDIDGAEERLQQMGLTLEELKPSVTDVEAIHESPDDELPNDELFDDESSDVGAIHELPDDEIETHQ